MLLSHALRAVQVALAAACLYVGYVGVSPILSAVSVAETTIPPAGETPPRDTDFKRFEVIASRNLFKSQVEEIVDAPVQEEIQETKLKLRLHGTAASDPHEFSVAIIEDIDRRERITVSVNDTIANGAKVVRIERRRVVIDNRGVQEAISMDDEDAKKDIKTRRAKQAKRDSQRARRIRRERPPRQRPVSDRVAELKKQQERLDKQGMPAGLNQKLHSVLTGAQLGPYFSEKGEFGGVKLSRIKKGGPFDGMEEGTVCFEINGKPMTGVQSLPQEVSSAKDGAACVKCRTPDGTEITRCL